MKINKNHRIPLENNENHKTNKFTWDIRSSWKTGTSFENYENHEKHIISNDNNENQENLNIIVRITKILKIINFHENLI